MGALVQPDVSGAIQFADVTGVSFVLSRYKYPMISEDYSYVVRENTHFLKYMPQLLITHLQFLVVILKLNLKWPGSVTTLLRGASGITSMAEQLSASVSPGCLSDDGDSAGSSLYMTWLSFIFGSWKVSELG